MGLLSFRSKRDEESQAPGLLRLTSGSFTLDPNGRVGACTLPRSFPPALIQEIGRRVLKAFESARRSQCPVTEIVAEYAALKLTARELRGGAIIFLAPRGLAQK